MEKSVNQRLKNGKLNHVTTSRIGNVVNNTHTTVSFEELPEHMTWLTDNPFLLRHHRNPTTSLLTCVTSNFSCLHTESLNILTHLIPTLLTLYALLHLLLYSQPISLFSHDVVWQHTPTMDRLVLCFVLAGTLSCFGLSTLYHTFSCHRLYGGHFLTADLMGIVIHGYSMTQATEYFIFYSHPHIIITSFVSNLFFTCVCMLLINTQPFSQPDKKILRCGLFCTYGILIFAPPMLCLTFNIFTRVDLFTYLLFCIAPSISMTGALLYSVKFPESCCPGVCDVWGQSHTTMHLTSAVAALIIYQAVLLSAELAYTQ